MIFTPSDNDVTGICAVKDEGYLVQTRPKHGMRLKGESSRLLNKPNYE